MSDYDWKYEFKLWAWGGCTVERLIDRKKVIKGLRQHCDGSMFDRCGECPYYEIGDKPFECRDALLEDALGLLKAQEQEEDPCENCQEFTCDDCKIWEEKHKREAEHEH